MRDLVSDWVPQSWIYFLMLLLFSAPLSQNDFSKPVDLSRWRPKRCWRLRPSCSSPRSPPSWPPSPPLAPCHACDASLSLTSCASLSLCRYPFLCLSYAFSHPCGLTPSFCHLFQQTLAQ